MAIAKTKLEYISLSTGNWVQAVNTNGQDAVVMMTVEQSINASAKADIILSNRSIDPTSDGTPAKGPLTDVFAEFQRIRLIHQEIGIPIFSGRIYRVRDIYDAQYGQTIRVVAFDSLKEFKEYPIEDGADSLESVDTTDSDEGGYDLRKRSQVIKYMLDELKLKDTNLLTTDTNQFEDSWSTDSLGDKKLDLTKLDRNVAGVIHDLAIADPVKNSSATAIGESGYDYRVEPRFLSNAANHKPIDSLHYFMRGTRPGKGGAYGASAAPVLTTTATDSLTIEYTNSSSPADSGLKQTMMPTYEFDKPKGELITSVICHYTDEGKEDESNADESPGRTEGVVTFELFKGSALSGTFTWAGKALDVNKPGVINVPELLNITDGISSACRVQWQNTDSNYLLVSNISPNFPTADEDITLTGATSGATFVMNPATARMSVKYGVQRPFRIQRPLSSDLGIIRDEVVSRLVGRTDLVITRGKFQTVKYPIVYHELVNTATPPASTTSRSGNTITWTGAIAAQTQGVRLGHIIAEMDTVGGYTRYAWISAITNDRSINYGATATDTSDGTALDASKILRIIIPLRPGDVIRVKNAQSGVNTDQVILSLGYDESPGMFSARYETVGSNNKFNNIYEEGEELRTTIAAITPKKFPDPKSFGETSFFFDGFINRGVNPSSTNDYRQIHWTNAASDVSGTAGKLTMGDGAKFTIACANSATLTTDEHTIFFRPAKARATANKSDTTFQVLLTTSYTKDSDDILVGWCFASDNKAGAKAVLVLAPQFSSKNLFAAGQNGTLTEALLSKSAQEYSSGLEITPVTSGFDSPNTRFQQVTWAACTSAEERLTFGDGDYWSIAAKSGSNYSVTTNGSTYANITALALSSTYYVFIDTADTASGGTLTLRFTTKYDHISTADDGTFSSTKVIMGQIAVPANGDGGAAPRIFPFNNRSLTINAASIAADSITATHVTATAIDVTHLKITGTDKIGGIAASGNINLSFADNTLPSSKLSLGGDENFATDNEITAAQAAALGLNQTTGNIIKNVVANDASNSPTFYSWSGTTTTPGNLVLVNAQGIAGYSGVTGTYSEGAAGNTTDNSASADGLRLPANAQFEIRTTDGRGYFGAGKITLGDEGIQFDYSGQGNANALRWAHANTSGNSLGTYTWLYRANHGNSGDTDLDNGKHLILTHDADSGSDPEGCALYSTVDFGMPYPRDIPHVHANQLICRSITGPCITDSHTGSASHIAVSQTALAAHVSNVGHGSGSGDIEGVNITAGYAMHGSQNTTSGTHTQTLAWTGSTLNLSTSNNDADYFVVVNSSGYSFKIAHGDISHWGGSSYTHPDPIRLGSGTASIPTYSFSTDTDTGMYRYSNNAIGFSTYQVWKFVVDYAGTSYFNGNVEITGSIAKLSGTLKIPHPLDEENKTLVHGFVESPRYDLVYRGTVTLSDGTATASIDEASNNMTVGTFTALTKNPQVWVQNETGWGAVKGRVEDGNIIITAEDTTSSDTISWLVIAERNDTYINSSKEPWTDENGTFVPEWDTAAIPGLPPL